MKRPRRREGNALLKMTRLGSGRARVEPAWSDVRTTNPRDTRRNKGGELAAGRRRSGLFVCCVFHSKNWALRIRRASRAVSKDRVLRTDTNVTASPRQGLLLSNSNYRGARWWKLLLIPPTLALSYRVSILIMWINVSIRLSSLKNNGKE